MELVGKNIRLRSLEKPDLSKMVNWNRDSEIQYYVDCDLPDNLVELERWFNENISDRYYRIFVLETFDNQVIGDLELDHICWSKFEAELRIRIGEKDYWGKGLGSESIQLILNYLFEEKSFKRIYLRVYHFNRRAIRCYMQNGFKQIGVLQRKTENWKDIILMEVTPVQFKKAKLKMMNCDSEKYFKQNFA